MCWHSWVQTCNRATNKRQRRRMSPLVDKPDLRSTSALETWATGVYQATVTDTLCATLPWCVRVGDQKGPCFHTIEQETLPLFVMRPSSLGGGRILRRTMSVRLSVCPSVPLSSVTWRHLANYNDTYVLFGRGPHIVRPSRPHKFLFAWCLTALSAHIGYMVP